MGSTQSELKLGVGRESITGMTLELALALLRSDGRRIGISATTTEGDHVIAVDGVYETTTAICEMAAEVQQKRQNVDRSSSVREKH